MIPITVRMAIAINLPNVKVSWMRVAHLTLAQLMNIVAPEIRNQQECLQYLGL